MKTALLIVALTLGYVACQQHETNWFANSTCTLQTESTACASYLAMGGCCATVTVKNGSVSSTFNRCLSRQLVDTIPNNTVGTVTVSYACVNTTRPVNNTPPMMCMNETSCRIGHCCAAFNYTHLNTPKNQTSMYCTPGEMGKNPGHRLNFIMGSTAGDISVSNICPFDINPEFYADSSFAQGLKSVVSFVLFLSAITYGVFAF